MKNACLRLSIGLGFGLMVFATNLSSVFAADSNEKPLFELRHTVYTPPESQPLKRCLVIFETNQIGFLPPAEWNVQARPQERKVTLSPLDGTAQMVFTFYPEFASKTNDLTKVEVSPLFEKKYPGAKIKEEFAFHCGCASGLGYELNTAATPGVARLEISVGYVLLPIGAVEFQLLCTASQKEALRIPYDRFLTSFVLEPKDGVPTAETKP